MRPAETCYMCEEIATSREHVPPKCIFPKSAEIEGGNHRLNLITVPSCDLHNINKSRDDEFLMVSIAGIIGNNSVGYRHKLGKVNRAIRRSSSRLLDRVYLKRKHFVVEFEENKFVEVIWGTPDLPRMLKCFEHIAYGIYRHHFGKRFLGKIKVMPVFLTSEDKNSTNMVEFIRHKVVSEMQGAMPIGDNPEVFTYNFGKRDQFGLFLLRMIFYGGIEIYTSFLPDGTTMPQNLAMRLIDMGIKTHVRYEDKVYIFNG